MDKRFFLKGLAAVTAVAITPSAFKSLALAGTNISPIPKKEFISYDPVAMTYVKEVIGRIVPLTIREEKIKSGWIEKSVNKYPYPIQTDISRANFYLSNDLEARSYFKSLPKREMPIEYWIK